MNELEYKEICSLCDELLTQPDISIEKVSIANLHVLNEHPVTLEKYTNFFSSSYQNIFSFVKFIVKFFIALFSFNNTNESYFSSIQAPSNVDVIFISHLLNESQIRNDEDFYFGNMTDCLEKDGLSSVTILNNHTEKDSKELMGRFAGNSSVKIMLPDSLSYWNELGFRYSMLRQSFSLYKKSFNEVDIKKKQALIYAAAQAVSMSSIKLLRFYYQIQNVVRSIQPKSLVVTYEGHAWEKLAFSAARSIDPKIRCIGYQHAILFPRQHAIKMSLGENYDPDVILTAGNVTNDILASNKALHRIKISTVGTHRQEEPVSDIYNKYQDKLIPSCLIIPDGNITDCINIIKFTYKIALEMPGIKFVIRMHPLLVFEKVISNYADLKAVPVNIEISQMDIVADFSRCQWALYRGSGAAIRATAAGLRPIYLSLDGELDIDPLYKLNSWKRMVINVNEFVCIIKNDLKESREVLNKEFMVAREYSRNYFTPVDTIKFISEILQ